MIGRIYRILTGFGRQMTRANVSAYASSCAFFLFLSLIPILILICSLLPFTPIQKSDLLKVVEMMPQPIIPLMLALIESVYNSTIGIVSAAAVVMIWSAGKGVLALMRGLNAMNGVVEDRNYIVQRLIASFYTLVMLILLVGTLTIMVFGNVLVDFITRTIPALRDLFHLFLYLRIPFTWFILSVFFTMMYAYIPNCKLKLRSQIPGAVFTSVSWNIFSWGFSVYIEKFNGLNMYGSLTTVVIMMLWLYMCLYLFLAGAHINRFVAPFRREIRHSRR